MTTLYPTLYTSRACIAEGLYSARTPCAQRMNTLEDGVVKGVSSKDPLPFDDGTVARDNQPEGGHVASRTRLRSEASTPGPSKRCVASSTPSDSHPSSYVARRGASEDNDSDEAEKVTTSSGGGQCDAA